MNLCDINPFMRYAELQPSVMSCAPLSCSYDYRLFYIIGGEAKLILTDRAIPLSSGMLIYFRPATPYYFDGDVKIIVLNFDMTRNHTDQQKPLPPSKNRKSFKKELVIENDPPRELEQLIVVEKSFAIEEKMQECLLHYCYPTPLSDAITSAIIKEILCHVAQNTIKKETELPEIVQRITLYIQKNHEKQLSNWEISNEFGYHSYYLNRLFKKSTGITLHQAVLQEKIRIAKKLLKETALPIHDVAAAVGFSDNSQFCAAFRKQTGLPPSEYRKEKNTYLNNE